MKKDVYLERFGDEVNHYQGLMQEAFEGVINEGVSNYPVFIFHQHEVNVGLPIVDRAPVAAGGRSIFPRWRSFISRAWS